MYDMQTGKFYEIRDPSDLHLIMQAAGSMESALVRGDFAQASSHCRTYKLDRSMNTQYKIQIIERFILNDKVQAVDFLCSYFRLKASAMEGRYPLIYMVKSKVMLDLLVDKRGCSLNSTYRLRSQLRSDVSALIEAKRLETSIKK